MKIPQFSQGGIVKSINFNTRECSVVSYSVIANFKTIKELLIMLISSEHYAARQAAKDELQKRKKEMLDRDDMLVSLRMAYNPKRYKDWVLIE